MARNAIQAAAQSGREATRTYKNKEVREQALREVIDDLISEQRGICNISGLKLQFLGDCDDKHMLASLDRIDSDGHYENKISKSFAVSLIDGSQMPSMQIFGD